MTSLVVQNFGSAEQVNNCFARLLIARAGESRKATIERAQEGAGLTEGEIRASRAYFPIFHAPNPSGGATAEDIVPSAHAS